MADAPHPIPLETTACLLCGSREYRTVASGYDYEYWTSEQQFSFVGCSRCGHVFLNPRPLASAAPAIYPANYYTLQGRHAKRNLIGWAKSLVVRRRLAAFKSVLQGGGSVLEIGCGDGGLLLDLRTAYPSAKITGIDLAVPTTTAEVCRERDIQLIQGAIEDVPLAGNAYDLVIMNQVLEHLWEPTQVLRKIFGAMRENGYLSIETPDLDGYDRRCFATSAWGGYYFPRHLNLFSFSSLARLLTQNGFEVVKQYSLSAPIVWAFSFQARLCPTRQKTSSLWRKLFSDRNPVCLALFTMLDLCATTVGMRSSNQKTIARKSGAVPSSSVAGPPKAG